MAKQVVKTKKTSVKLIAKATKPAVKKTAQAAKPAAKSAAKKKAVVKSAKASAKAPSKPLAKKVAKVAASKPSLGAKVKAAGAQKVKAKALKTQTMKAPVQAVAKKIAKTVTKDKVTKKAAPVSVKAPVKPALKSAAKPVAKKSVRPARLSPVALAPAPVVDWTEDKLKTVKTGLNKKDLEQFRQSLLEHRAEIVGDMQGMESARNVSAGDLSHMPLHMADVGSDNYDQEFTIGILESERKILNEIDAALVRMEKGYYGVCIETGQAIERPRLEAMPWAKYGKEAALRREKQIGG